MSSDNANETPEVTPEITETQPPTHEEDVSQNLPDDEDVFIVGEDGKRVRLSDYLSPKDPDPSYIVDEDGERVLLSDYLKGDH